MHPYHIKVFIELLGNMLLCKNGTYLAAQKVTFYLLFVASKSVEY